MRKKVFMIAFTAAVAVGLCACKTKQGGDVLPSPEVVSTGTPAPTETAGTEAAGTDTVEQLPITNYDECIAKTTLPENYFGIEVKKVSGQEVEDYIADVLEENQVLSEVDRAVETGDAVDIDYAGYLDGEAFDGGTGNIGDLVIGSGQFIPGFEEGLIGMQKGEKRSLPLTFPAEYRNNPDLAGKNVVFEVTLNHVYVYELPTLDDAFVSEFTEEQCKTTEEFRTYVADMLKENREYETVLDYLLENTEFSDLNEEFITANLNSMKGYYEMYAQLYGLDIETFMLYNGVADADAFWKTMEEEMRREEKERVVLYCVAKKENISLTEEEFNQKVEELATSYDMTVEDFLAQQDRTYVEQSILMERGLDLLLQNVVTVE